MGREGEAVAAPGRAVSAPLGEDGLSSRGDSLGCAGTGGAASAAGADAPLRVVTVGGGTGQPAVIRALRSLAARISIDAVVAMADDGRSSGALRAHEGMVPPGDVRKCLVALATDPDCPLARALEHRFGYLEGHAMGNLLIAALADEGMGFEGAVAELSRLLGCVGRVLPSTLDRVALAGITRAGGRVCGQARLSYGEGTGPLSRVWMVPSAPAANPAAVRAILDADAVVLGPGSLFTSVIPNLLVPGILDALRATAATRVFVCPRADEAGECAGMGAEAYVSALEAAGLVGAIDAVILNRPAEPVAGSAVQDVALDEAAARRLSSRVPRVLVRDLASRRDPRAYARAALAGALEEVLAPCRSARR